MAAIGRRAVVFTETGTSFASGAGATAAVTALHFGADTTNTLARKRDDGVELQKLLLLTIIIIKNRTYSSRITWLFSG